jgi:hypothetical protein
VNRHPIRVLAVAAVLALSLGGVVALTAPRAQRSALLAGLERPAQALPVVVLGHAHRLTLAASPNRASARNEILVRLGSRGRGARVTVSWSMPAMNMWHVLTSCLRPRGDGVYAAEVPVLGMAGDWRLYVRVIGAGAPPLGVDMRDHLRS